MSNRWADWPRGIRWLVWIAAVVLALLIVWALLVPGADWLARHDIGSAKGSLATARDAARGRLLTLGAGLLAAGALLFTARNFTLSRRTFELTEQGQVTDRFTKAIEQLGSDKLDVRIGGIYALERVARDSAKDHPTVMEVLTAFVREHSREPWPLRDPDDDEEPARLTRPDVQAALSVVGRRGVERDIQRIDLIRADLTNADLTGAVLAGAVLARAVLAGANLGGARLGGAVLTDARLTGAGLVGADLGGARLTRARLTGADLTGARLDGADLFGADLTRADLSGAVLARARLSAANLTGARLIDADLTGANLDGANLDGARLIDADLTGADLGGADLGGADLGGADLTDVMWPDSVAVPEGWRQNTDSSRLEKADTSTGG